MIALALCATAFSPAFAQSGVSPPATQPAPTLDEMVAQLRTNSGDDALRERIIVRVAKMRTKPAVPEEARRAFVQGNAAFTAAQGRADYQRASDRFLEAQNLAPWWGDAYFNQSKVREQQGDFDRAIRNLRWYLLSAPPAADARIAQDQIYVLEEKKTAAAQRRTDDAARAARESANRENAVWAAIDGARYVCPTETLPSTQYGPMYAQNTVMVSGRTITSQIRIFGPGVRRGGGDSVMPGGTSRVTGISGNEVQHGGRGERVGPSSALVEFIGGTGRSGFMTCPRQ